MKTKHDWSRLDALTEDQRHAAALADPDARPLSDADMDRMKATPRLKIIRRALGLTQEEFATRYQIPLGTLRDWEQGAEAAGPGSARLSPGDRRRPGRGATCATRARPAARVNHDAESETGGGRMPKGDAGRAGDNRQLRGDRHTCEKPHPHARRTRQSAGRNPFGIRLPEKPAVVELHVGSAARLKSQHTIFDG